LFRMMFIVALLTLCAITATADEVCKEPDTNKTLTCSGAKPDCCVGGRYGPASCFNKSSEECCQNEHGVSQACSTGKCLHGGRRASSRVSCCSADTSPCNGQLFFDMGECCKAGQQCCAGLGKCCSADSVCCGTAAAPGGLGKCCPAESTCCSTAGSSKCCAKGEKCVIDSEHPVAPNSTKCVSSLPAFMTVV
jgi:hypothetical protein